MFYTNVKVWGNKVLHRFVDDKGQRRSESVIFTPTLYVPSNKSDGKWKSIDGRPLAEMPFETIKEAKNFLERYEGVESFEIFGNSNWQNQFITNNYGGEVVFDRSKLVVAIIDIEVNSSNGFPKPEEAREPITAITVMFNDMLYTYGTKDYTSKRPDHKFIKYPNEYEMLRGFLKRWQHECPDVLSGWNSDGFDVPYIVNRMKQILGEEQTKDLSPHRIVLPRTMKVKIGSNYKDIETYELGGIAVLDLRTAYQKFVLTPRESYTLGYISSVELEDAKIEYDEETGLQGLYENDYETFIDYNVKDVLLVRRLDDKLRLIDLILMLSYQAKCNYDDAFSQVRMWDSLIYNHLHGQGISIPQKKEAIKTEKYDGAFVKEPKVGVYKWVVSFDLNSLYPSLFIQYNIGPDTLVPIHLLPKEVREFFTGKDINVDNILNRKYDFTDLLKRHNLTLTPNGQFFKTDREAFMPVIVASMGDKRRAAKNEMLALEQKLESMEEGSPEYIETEKRASYLSVLEKSIKVTMNSMYGAAGNQYFRFYDIRIAKAITSSGQLALLWIEKKINGWLNELLGTTNVDYVIYADTDSVYIHLDKVVQRATKGDTKDVKKVIEFMDRLCNEKLQKVITAGYAELREYLNAPKAQLVMKREALADSGIWDGKKRYILNVHNSEGVQFAEPKIKVKGLEIVKSSSPEVVRKALKKSVEYMLADDLPGLRKYVADFKMKFKAMDLEQFAFPRGVSNIKKYHTGHGEYVKGTPLHVRAAINFNRMVVDKKLTNKYKLMNDGEKLKYVYLREPNPLKENVIAFRSRLPDEFDIRKYVDYDTMYEKVYLEPLNNLLESVGWELEERATLDGLYD